MQRSQPSGEANYFIVAILSICMTSGTGWSQTNRISDEALVLLAEETNQQIPTGLEGDGFGYAPKEEKCVATPVHGVARCERCSFCCGPFTMRVGPALIKRERMDDVPVLINNGGAGPTALSARDFGFDYEAGIDATLTYNGCDWPLAIEARYQWINDWTAIVNGGGLTNAVINTNPQTFTFGAAFDAAYRSELQTFELNLRRECTDCVSLLAGFRYIDFDERLDLSVGGAQNYWMTGNKLYGFQFGSDVVFHEHCGGLRIEGFGRAGVYGNDADTAVRIDVVEVGAVSQSSGMDHVAFFGEVGLAASYQLTPCWSVRAGYQVSWLEGVLAAGNQVPLTTNNAAVQGFDYSGVLFHGATLLAEARW